MSPSNEMQQKLETGNKSRYRWKSIASVRNEHARLPDGAIADRHTLDESSGCHFFFKKNLNLFSF